jgi:hypothetical protein
VSAKKSTNSQSPSSLRSSAPASRTPFTTNCKNFSRRRMRMDYLAISHPVRKSRNYSSRRFLVVLRSFGTGPHR